MDVITIESRAFQEILKKIDAIENQISKVVPMGSQTEKWLSVKECCAMLKISSRTLQSYRDEGVLPFSQHRNKIYIKLSDIQLHLEKYYSHPENLHYEK